MLNDSLNIKLVQSLIVIDTNKAMWRIVEAPILDDNVEQCFHGMNHVYFIDLN